VHVAMDAVGHLLAVHVTPANEGDRKQGQQLAEAVRQAKGHKVQIAYVVQAIPERRLRKTPRGHQVGGGQVARSKARLHLVA
jgi:hypothetical protein